MVTVGLLLVGGFGLWRWRQRRAANLSGVWRERIGLRGAGTSREGTLMLVTLAQKDRSVGLASTVGIETDPQWEAVRDAWKERTGGELKQVIYRGEGEFIEKARPRRSPRARLPRPRRTPHQGREGRGPALRPDRRHAASR